VKDKYVPFLHWQRGGMTHYADCWKDHLTCALIRATDLLEEYAADADEFWDDWGDGEGPADIEAYMFIKHIREEM
jgi:hypothetical protein